MIPNLRRRFRRPAAGVNEEQARRYLDELNRSALLEAELERAGRRHLEDTNAFLDHRNGLEAELDAFRTVLLELGPLGAALVGRPAREQTIAIRGEIRRYRQMIGEALDERAALRMENGRLRLELERHGVDRGACENLAPAGGADR